MIEIILNAMPAIIALVGLKLIFDTMGNSKLSSNTVMIVAISGLMFGIVIIPILESAGIIEITDNENDNGITTSLGSVADSLGTEETEQFETHDSYCDKYDCT